MQETYGYNPRLLPQSLHDSYGTPKAKLPRIAHEEHQMNWVEAIKGKAEARRPFEYAAQLTEVMLLGIVVAARAEQDLLRRGEHADHQRRRGERFARSRSEAGIRTQVGRTRGPAQQAGEQ